MKARVKATGEIIDVEPEPYIANDRWDIGIRFTDNDDNIYRENQLDFEDFTQGETDVKEKSLPKDEPDYWEKLKHQYAGMAMQGMLSNSDYIERFTAHTIDGISFEDDLARYAKNYATALVNILKNESQCEK